MKARGFIMVWLSLVLLSAIACQKEEREFIDESQDNTIPKDSRLAKLMRDITTHDGSYDDLVDGGNCYSINLPYTILLNGKEKEITKLSDYIDIHTTDFIEIQYPITITMHDYIEKSINNKEQLTILAALCSNEDDDIECIDFNYPFKLSTFNTNTNVFKTIDAIHDAQLFVFMSDLNEEMSISIKYPIIMELHNGQNTEAAHNTDLLSTILEYAVSCDENDNNPSN
ncbi:hypothetical protein ABW636_16135 [Aquimarina sp. 2201CG1-2-11]|uniref:hypothetical protein n=1 Tax=Aquimarina discodermiae TaxID=3231043 RepID=UPI0034625AEC